MSERYPLEALLRPPVELWSAVVATIAAGIALLAPWALLMTPAVATATAALLAAVALRRGATAYRLLHYQRYLRRLPRYALRANAVPVSRRKLFLGRGFRWKPTHTQRLRDAARPHTARYAEPGRFAQWARQREIAWESRPGLRRLARLLALDSPWNPLRPPPPVGGRAALHGVEPTEQPVWMDLSERVGHLLVLGTTRVGKTRLAELLIAQDIQRGDVVIVFDPKGDPALLRRVWAEAERAGRADALVIFHLGHPSLSARYNPIGRFDRITEVAGRLANQLPAEGNSAAFKEFAWRFVNIIARALVALGRRPDYHQIRSHINNIEPLLLDYTQAWLDRSGPTGWADAVTALESGINDRTVPAALRGRSKPAIALFRYLEAHPELDDPVAEGLISAFRYDRTYFDKIVSSLGPLVEKLTTAPVAELIAPDYLDAEDARPIFDWKAVIERRGIVYVGLDALADATVASAVGNAMFADLTSVAGARYREAGLQGEHATPWPINLHCDEFNELIGEEFIPLINKAGGAHFQVTAYTQTWSDVEARMGSRAKAGQIAGNFNTLIMLRVKELATALMLTDQLPKAEVFSLMEVSGTTDSPEPGTGVDFGSRSEDRLSVTEVPLVEPADIVALPKGQAFALLEGGALWKLRMPLPEPLDEEDLPETLAELAQAMQARYRSSEQWWREAGTFRVGNDNPW